MCFVPVIMPIAIAAGGKSCCYCLTSAVPKPDQYSVSQGSTLQLGFGGEGPHPTTNTSDDHSTRS
jgi:hypothetical protein